MNFGISLKNSLILFFALLFIAKIIIYKYLPLDSDEVMWSVMAEEMMEGQRFYLFFTTQNFTGAFESYFIMPFQLLFGYGLSILRIGSVAWGLGSSILIYLILKRHIKASTHESILATLFYNLMLPENLYIHAKAWGNYVLTEFLMLTSIYLFIDILKTKKFDYKVIVLGIIFGFNFWQNMQSLYYALLIIGLSFLFYLYNSFKERISYKSLILDFVPVLISIFNLYMIGNKKMIFNPAFTLISKLGYNISNPQNFDIHINIFIYTMWVTTALWLFFKKTKDHFLQIYLLLVNLMFIGIYIAIKYNSFSRVSAEGGTFAGQLEFLNKIILNHFLGNYWFIIIGLIFIGILVRLITLIKVKELIASDLIYAAFVFFGLIFLVSNVPQLTMTSRYLIIWWPIIVLSLMISLKDLFRNRYVLLIVLLIWAGYIGMYSQRYIELYNQTRLQKEDVMQKVNNIKLEGYQYCDGNYWTIGLIMFYSEMHLTCWNDESFGWDVDYLDHYKDKFKNERIYHVK